MNDTYLNELRIEIQKSKVHYLNQTDYSVGKTQFIKKEKAKSFNETLVDYQNAQD